MRTRGRVVVGIIALVALLGPAGLASPIRPEMALAQGSVSDTIEDSDSGALLDFAFHGGTISHAAADGFDYLIEGTVRSGETISFAASGHGTTFTGRHHVNEDQEAALSVWVEGTDVRDDVIVEPGGSGSVSISYLVPSDARRVDVVAIISNAWINPHGGGSRSLIVRARLDVVAPTTTTMTAPSTTAPRSGGWWSTDEDDCDIPSYSPDAAPAAWARYGVRFGDLHGEVNVRPNCADDDAWVFAELTTPLHHDDRIRTSPRSGAILSFSDMATFVMKEETIIILDVESVRESKIALITGNVWINLQRMIEGKGLEVEMAQAVAGIKGTTLIAEETGSSSIVKVLEGTVDVTPHGLPPIEIGAGQMLEVTADGPLPVTTFDIDAELARWDDATRALTDDALGTTRDDGGMNLPVVLALIAAAALVVVGAVLFTQIRHRRLHPMQPF